MRKILFITFSAIAIVLLSSLVDAELIAQCPMCKMSAEQNLKDGGTAGAGLNRGILYMLLVPYLLVGSLGFLWWKNRRRLDEEIFEPPFSEN